MKHWGFIFTNNRNGNISFKINQFKVPIFTVLWVWSSRITEVVEVKNSFPNTVLVLERGIQSSPLACRNEVLYSWKYSEGWCISLLKWQELLYENLWPRLFYFMFVIIFFCILKGPYFCRKHVVHWWSDACLRFCISHNILRSKQESEKTGIAWS